ncbi:MAG: hypothetical protein QM831_12635 [Kofleriaceae bacterium]
MSPIYGPQRLVADLVALGHEATLMILPAGEQFVVLPRYMVELGRFAGRNIELGLQATADFPRTVSSAIHVKAEPHLLDFSDSVPNVRNIQPSVLGQAWRYWSHNFGWTQERTARRLMSQIAKIFHDT